MFSVLIPCYRPEAEALDCCLRAILSQLPPGGEVLLLGDAGGSHATRRAAERHPAVAFHSWPEDLGGCRTVNRGIELATRELVHVCHPDDWVLPGFYANIADAAARSPSRALYAAEAVWCDGEGRPTHTPRTDLRLGRYFPPLETGNPLCVAACVVRRSFLVEHGGWRPELIHTADWEMWARAATLGRGFTLVGWPLACHTEGEGNHTHRLMRTAENLRDYLRLADVVKQYMPVDLSAFRAYVAMRARGQEAHYRTCAELAGQLPMRDGTTREGYQAAADANARLAEELEAEA